jgi:hypothetical protein
VWTKVRTVSSTSIRRTLTLATSFARSIGKT